MKFYSFLIIVFLIASCTPSDQSNQIIATANPISNTSNTSSKKSLSKFWYQGKAEINVYKLQQTRYNDVHPGQAVLVFVTEDFLSDKQVKNDNYKSSNSIPVFKNNQMRKFTTGVYDYSMMNSVFTPVDTENIQSLKITSSNQEWCGQTYTQLNKKGKQYKVASHSYFENEADEAFNIDAFPLEDELFNHIRIDPNSIKTGKQKMIPSLFYTRLKHKELKPYDAVVSMDNELVITYPELDRTVRIQFDKEAPYEILGWSEQYKGFDGQSKETIATRISNSMEPYWSQNDLSHTKMRDDLGLPRY